MLQGLLLLLVAGACRADIDRGPVEVASVEIVLDTARVLVTNTIEADAAVFADDGTLLLDRTTTWSASPSSVLEHVGGGTFLGVGVGEATITATVEGQSATAFVTVYEVTYLDEVIQADSVLELRSDSAEVSSGNILRFATPPGGSVTIAVGDVLVGTAGGGYGRVVTNGRRHGGPG